MIDVHVLTHSGTRQDWLDQCLESLRGERCRVHVIEGVEGSVGAGRAKGYATGDYPLVAYVDSDDYVLPGTMARCAYAMMRHRAVVTQELVEYPDGRRFKFPRNGHALTVYRRGDVWPYLELMKQSPHSTDMHLRALLRPHQLDFIGYVWRVHPGGDHHNLTREAFEQETQLWQPTA